MRVEPEPPNGSNTNSPGRVELRMNRPTNFTGFIVGWYSLSCGDDELSFVRYGDNLPNKQHLGVVDEGLFEFVEFVRLDKTGMLRQSLDLSFVRFEPVEPEIIF